MREGSEGSILGGGAGLLALLLAGVVVLAGFTGGYAFGGWPPPSVFLTVGVLLVFLFAATRPMDKTPRPPAKTRAESREVRRHDPNERVSPVS